MKMFLRLICVAVAQAKVVYDNYSFDYSAQKMPLWYETYGNAVELQHKVKLNSAVPNKGGAYVLTDPVHFSKDLDIDIEFTINTPLDEARGFTTILSKSPF